MVLQESICYNAQKGVSIQKPPNNKSKRIIDVFSKESNKKGFFGALESLLRKYRPLAFFTLSTLIIFICMLAAGISLIPSVFLFKFLTSISANMGPVGQAFFIGIGISFGYFFYGVSSVFVCPLFNFPVLLFKLVRPWKGSWYSIEGIPWYYHNALTFLVRFSFLDFITPTPLNILFFKLMGMKIGKNVVINTSYISDPCLITLEDNVTIGGSVTLFAHYGQQGILILAPVVIKKNVTIGLKCSIMGDVVINEDVIIAPHSVVLPKSRVTKEVK